MLRKLLFHNQSKKQLVIALIGSLLGMVFLVLSIHYSIIIQKFGEGTDVLGPNTLIVQKKVTNSSSLNLTKTDFSLKEIEKIKVKDFVKDIQPISSNNFDISFETSDPLVPYFRSDIFVQTIPENFIDVHTAKWKWKKGDKYVPMIMPREFLVMLNTFMSASGIPQISEELVKEVSFKFKVWNNSKTEKFDVKIIGFTNEVSSILIPASFMEFCNLNYGNSKEEKITQVLILGEEGRFGLVEEMLKERGLEPKNSQLIVGRLKSVVGTLFAIIFMISLITVFTSLLVLIQYIQLLLTKNSYEIRTLLRMGYFEKSLVKIITTNFIRLVGLICVISFVLFLGVKILIDEICTKGGLYIDTGFTLESIVGLSIAFLLFVIISFKIVQKEVVKLF